MTTMLLAPEKRPALPAVDHRPPADRDPLCVYLTTRKTESTRSTMAQALERVARVLTSGALPAEALPWHQLRRQHLAGLVAALNDPPSRKVIQPDGSESIVYPVPESISPRGEPFAAQSVNKMLTAAKGVLREAWRLGLVSTDDYQRTVDVKGLRVPPSTSGRALSEKEIHRLRAACGDELGGQRDAALLAVLFAGGVRRNEAVHLDLRDWHPGEGRLEVRKAKGHTRREVYIRNGSAEALKAWVEIRGDQPGPLFLGVRHGRLGKTRLTPQAVYDILLRLGVRAKVEAFSPHDLRRTCASTMLEKGADLFAVQAHLGHANPATTARYDRRGEKAKQAAASLLHFPF